MNAAFNKTRTLFTFYLKKEWLTLLLWLLGCLAFVFIGVFAFVEIYNDPGEREALAVALSNPAMEALFGRVIGADNYTIGAMYSHTMTQMGFVLFSIQSILLVVRNTRAEEEDGMIELLQALPIGRLAHTASAILLLLLQNLALAVGTIGILLLFEEQSITTEGVLLTGIIYAAIGLLFGAFTLVTAQLSSSARGATVLAFSILGLSYILRIIGDGGVEVLSWLSPFGLLYGTEPFVHNYWWPVWIAVGVCMLLLLLSLYLKVNRDLGSGLLPDRSGTSFASVFLKNQFGFIFRLVRTPLIAWTIGVIILGVTYGSVIGDVEGIVQGNEIVEQILGTDPSVNMTEQFMMIIIALLSIITVIPSLQVVLRIRGEEKKNRLGVILAGSSSREKVLGSFLVFSLFASFWMQLLQIGSFAGAAVVMDFDVSFSETILAGLAYMPAIWLMCGLTVLLMGWLPKLTPLVWLYLTFTFIILYFGELFNIPEWIQGLSPFTHIPELPSEEWNWTVFGTIVLLAIIFSVIGIIGFKKRDIEES